MNKIWIIILGLAFSLNIFSQDNSFCPTYVYDGFIKTDQEQKLEIRLNFLVLLDSTLVGSYYYNPQNGSLKLAGHLYKNNTFNLVERDKNESVTGFFKGKVSDDKSKAKGEWTSSQKDKTFIFELVQVEEKTYWDYIKKNRALFEYKDFNKAINENEKVLSIDVKNQGIKRIPNRLKKLHNLVSINLMINKLKKFPRVLSKLITLDEISLSTNKIEKIGRQISKLKNLRILIINNNRLSELPKEIGELTNLLYLEIGNNQLTTLPDEIKYLTSLQELHIERNKLSETEKGRIKKLLPNCVIHFGK